MRKKSMNKYHKKQTEAATFPLIFIAFFWKNPPFCKIDLFTEAVVVGFFLYFFCTIYVGHLVEEKKNVIHYDDIMILGLLSKQH